MFSYCVVPGLLSFPFEVKILMRGKGEAKVPSLISLSPLKMLPSFVNALRILKKPMRTQMRKFSCPKIDRGHIGIGKKKMCKTIYLVCTNCKWWCHCYLQPIRRGETLGHLPESSEPQASTDSGQHSWDAETEITTSPRRRLGNNDNIGRLPPVLQSAKHSWYWKSDLLGKTKKEC